MGEFPELPNPLAGDLGAAYLGTFVGASLSLGHGSRLFSLSRNIKFSLAEDLPVSQGVGGGSSWWFSTTNHQGQQDTPGERH
jgi:hypothetical protein